MFKDFRPNLQPRPSATREEIKRQFRKGDQLKAAKFCTRLGFPLSGFQASIEEGARRLYHGHQAGLVLSFIYDTGVSVGIDILTLLIAMYEVHDYHGFLKQAHRFKIFTGIEGEIDNAIQMLTDKKQMKDAEAWRRKFLTLRNKK